MSRHDDLEPHYESSPTDHVLNELQLHGYRLFADEPDQRLLPDGNAVAGADRESATRVPVARLLQIVRTPRLCSKIAHRLRVAGILGNWGARPMSGDMEFCCSDDATAAHALASGERAAAARPASAPRRCRPPLWRSTLLALRTALLATALTVGTGTPTVAEGPAVDIGPTVAFDIPEQPLPSALQAYSAASGIAVLYRSEIGDAFRSAPVRGAYSRETALKMLLAHCDLVVRYTRADAITLVDPSVAAETPESVLGGADMVLDTLHVASKPERPDRAALSDYFDAVQQEIHRALRKSGISPGANYQLEAELWVDASRTIQRAAVTRSTGDGERDSRVATVLRGLTLRRAPPAHTPNPIRVKIMVRGS